MKEGTAMPNRKWPAWQRALAVAMAASLLSEGGAAGSNKVKLHGYITGRVDDKVILILDDRIETTPASHVSGQDSSGEHPMKAEELAVGMLVDAEGVWVDRHKFFAEKITADLRESDKKIHGTAYLQEEPADTNKIAAGQPGQLKLDGYLLEVGGNTKREWNVTKATGSSSGGSAAAGKLAACHVKYTATLRK